MPVHEVLVVEISGKRFGIRVSDVDEVQPAARLQSLPGAPTVVEGVLDLRGEIVPVIDGRRRVGAPAKHITPSDRFVVMRTDRHRVALRVDAALNLAAIEQADAASAASLAPEALRSAGLARADRGLILVYDPDSFLTPEEGSALGEALAAFDEVVT